MTVPAIEVKDMWFSFSGPPILRDVNVTVQEGEFLAVLGPNGGGKTTLIKIILGILKPDRGVVRVFGLEPLASGHRIGYVPQNVNINREFPISVMDATLMGRVRGGGGFRYSAGDRQSAMEALERMGMGRYGDVRIGELSGGQLQRVFIARALTSDPSLLIMDEPTSSVDTQGQTELYDFLRELNRTMTILVVTHDVSILHGYVKSVACVAETLYYHDKSEITPEMLERAYPCAVELVAHGLPHRMLAIHEDKK